MGMGDVKLAFLMGAALGRGVVLVLVIARPPFDVVLVRHGRAGLKIGFPFGPFAALGSLAALFAVGRL
jgi:prepilin signal peptidase PulO-like enzyme (type II secretory pathway)